MALCALSVGHAQSQTVPTGPSGGLEGRVVDAVSGRPVSGVFVRVYGVPAVAIHVTDDRFGESFVSIEGQHAEPIMTDAAGAFLFGELPDGVYGLAAFKSGLVEGQFGQRDANDDGKTVEIRNGQVRKGLILPLWRSAAIEGTITDERGRPRGGVRLRAKRVDDAYDRFEYSAETGSNGVYRLAVKPGRWILHTDIDLATSVGGLRAASVDGAPRGYLNQFYPGAAAEAGAVVFDLKPGQRQVGADMQLVSTPAFRIVGRVTGGRAPLPAVELHRRGRMFWRDPVSRAVPSPDGRFVFEAVTPGEYVVGMTIEPGMPRASHSIAPLKSPPANPTLFADVDVVVSDRDLDVPLALHTGGRISGTVRFNARSSAPLSDSELAEIPIVAVEASGRSLDIRGLFLPGRRWQTIEIPPGRYRLQLFAPLGWFVESVTVGGRDAMLRPFDVGAAGVTNAEITFADVLPTVRVNIESTSPDRRAWIVAFAADREAWTDVPINVRGVQQWIMGTDRALSISLPPEEYLLVALDRSPGRLTPEVLAALAPMARRVSLRPGEGSSLTLSVKAWR